MMQRLYLWAGLLFLIFSLPVQAGYSINTVEDGYTYNGSYWIKNGISYTRSRYYQPPVYYNGGYRQGYYFWSYVKYAAPVYSPPSAPPAKLYKAPAYTPGWQLRLLDNLKLRDDYQAYLRSLDAAGYKGQSPLDLASSYSLGGYNYRTVTQGLTGYNYSVNAVKDMYGDLNRNVLYQQASRLVERSQDYARDGNRDFAGLIADEGERAARIAEIRERAIAAARVYAATAPPASVTTRTSSSSSSSSAGGSTPLAMPPAEDGVQSDFLRLAGNPLCAKCHAGATIKGGFDVTKFEYMARVDQKKVWARLLTDDKSKQMPPPTEPQPTEAQNQLFFCVKSGG